MRKNHQEQQTLTPEQVGHEHAKELEAISRLLDDHPMIAELAMQDLVDADVDATRGAPGMTSDQVVRAALVKQVNAFSYRELAFHLTDSLSYQRFCRIGLGDEPPARATLAGNIKRIQPATWEAIHRVIIGAAKSMGIESGTRARIDCTAVLSPIHDPTDSSLLFDVVRVTARLLARAKALCPIAFENRTRRAKRRMLQVHNAKKSEQRLHAYRDLIAVTLETLEFAGEALPVLRTTGRDGTRDGALEVAALADELEHYAGLGWDVLDQTHDRVVQGMSVPASEKVVSIFEEHTDIIVKDRRDTLYGHKICLSTGASSLVLDCVTLDGNPADATLVGTMLDRHIAQYGKAPRQAAFDGGFASKANVLLAKGKGVTDACFSKRRGIPVLDMVKSTWVYKKLKRFRAGVEGCISFLKRCFGLDRCTWHGLASFKSYVWLSVVSCNLMLVARHQLA